MLFENLQRNPNLNLSVFSEEML